MVSSDGFNVAGSASKLTHVAGRIQWLRGCGLRTTVLHD